MGFSILLSQYVLWSGFPLASCLCCLPVLCLIHGCVYLQLPEQCPARARCSKILSLSVPLSLSLSVSLSASDFLRLGPRDAPKTPDAELSSRNTNPVGAVPWDPLPNSHHSRKKTDGSRPMAISAWTGSLITCLWNIDL